MKINLNVFTNALVLGAAVLILAGGAQAANRNADVNNRRLVRFDCNYKQDRDARAVRTEVIRMASTRDDCRLNDEANLVRPERDRNARLIDRVELRHERVGKDAQRSERANRYARQIPNPLTI